MVAFIVWLINNLLYKLISFFLKKFYDILFKVVRLRVVSGKYKSRIIKYVEDEKTRPTTDKVKESIFNIIGPYFDGGIVLDLFAGSGGIGIEAISRGMDKGYFIDTSKEAIKVINDNLKTLGIANSLVLKRDYLDFLNSTNEKFSLIFLDPPYRMHILEDILRIIHERGLLTEDGIVVCEYEKSYTFSSIYFEKIKEANYGIRNIAVYQERNDLL